MPWLDGWVFSSPCNIPGSSFRLIQGLGPTNCSRRSRAQAGRKPCGSPAGPQIPVHSVVGHLKTSSHTRPTPRHPPTRGTNGRSHDTCKTNHHTSASASPLPPPATMNATVCQAARCPSASASAASLAPRPLALGRPANPLRCAGGSGAGLLRSSRPAAGGRGMAVQAALLPAALPLLGQAVSERLPAGRQPVAVLLPPTLLFI